GLVYESPAIIGSFL
ncbi:hypothetical protein SLEP1_g14922, partial [Rubroshorea leprosula]